MTSDDLEILTHMCNGGRPPDFAVRLLEDVCTRTGLDWKARHVYLMSRGGKWMVTLSIDGFRTIGARHAEYAGQEGPFYVLSSDDTWKDIPPDKKPYAAKVGIKKRDGITTWGVAKFDDYAAGAMWTKFPSTMVAKCAEMLAWRKTFPDVFGGLYGQEEMDQAGKRSTPKELLGSALPPPPPSGEVSEVTETPFQMYAKDLKDAQGLLQVVSIGKLIQADKTLKVEDTLALHKLYTERKRALE